jgi:polyisoprenoid-binding protein YceI
MGTWKIDPAHTDVSFSAKHMMITTVRGKFDRVEGALELDEAQPTRSRGEIRVGAASLSTGFEARDQHLRSADFFDVEKHEWIVVRATSVEPQDSGTYKVTADVTIRGETRPVTFDVAYLGTTPGMTGARHAGFSARAKVNRKDWGLNWNMALEAGGWLVGDEIKLDIEVAADEVGVTAAVPANAAAPVDPAREGAVA